MAHILEEHDAHLEDDFPRGYLNPIKALWQDSGVGAAVRKGNEYGLDENLA